MALPGPGSGSGSVVAVTAAPSMMEDSLKKVRKPYTITKCRESWTEPEHDKFLEAIQLFDRDWKKIEAFVGSKTVIQIRSHAQKYFLKVEKNGTGERLPPPRPKRKAAHPYPQKASKNSPSQVSRPFQSSSALSKATPFIKPDSSSVIASSISGAAICYGAEEPPHTANFSHAARGQTMENNCCSSTEQSPRARFLNRPGTGEHNNLQLRVLPDFGQVYSFIGSVFDPNATNHLQRLKKMDQIDVETVLLLMRNLAINMASPAFEYHKRVLSSYEYDMEHG